MSCGCVERPFCKGWLLLPQQSRSVVGDADVEYQAPAASLVP